MSGSQVMLRVMARCASDAAADVLQQQLLQALAAFPAQVRSAPQRYWKMPELFEFTLTVAGAGHFAAVTGLSTTGWTATGDDDDPSWVWNAGSGAQFLHADAVWAEVLLAD